MADRFAVYQWNNAAWSLLRCTSDLFDALNWTEDSTLRYRVVVISVADGQVAPMFRKHISGHNVIRDSEEERIADWAAWCIENGYERKIETYNSERLERVRALRASNQHSQPPQR